MLIAISDCVYTSNQFFYQQQCWLHLPQLRSYTEFFKQPSWAQMSLIVFQNNKVYQLFDYFAIYFNEILTLYIIYDLYACIKKPFANKAAAMRFYTISAPLLAGFFALCQYIEVIEFTTYVYIVLYSTICLFGIFTVVFSLRSLEKQSISSTIRRLCLKRHITAIATFAICNFYLFYGSLRILIFSIENFKLHNIAGYLMKSLFYLQFVLVPMLRFTEKAFYSTLKKQVR